MNKLADEQMKLLESNREDTDKVCMSVHHVYVCLYITCMSVCTLHVCLYVYVCLYIMYICLYITCMSVHQKHVCVYIFAYVYVFVDLSMSVHTFELDGEAST